MILPSRNNSRPTGGSWTKKMSCARYPHPRRQRRTVNHYLVAADDCLTLQDLLDIYHDDETFSPTPSADPTTPNATCCSRALSNWDIIHTISQHD